MIIAALNREIGFVALSSAEISVKVAFVGPLVSALYLPKFVSFLPSRHHIILHIVHITKDRTSEEWGKSMN